jgi:glutaminyl-tRNA synthetase
MSQPASKAVPPAPAANFLRTLIERDIASGTLQSRRFGGSPGDAAHHAAGPLDPAKIRTRFPPEPNGYLHVGHAKSICLNFGLARDHGGICHLRFDDTNPEKEEQEYVDAIREALVSDGLAYVDEQTAEQMRANRGDFGSPGTDSPFRSRTPTENLTRLRQMKAGDLADGAAVLRARIDMASPNINLRDPALYRIKRATHHNTGDTWCIYPMYTFAHPIEDALEQITHSICTLEFEDQRPFYDWLMERLCESGLLAAPAPKQYEFARLNLTYVITSKRKLAQLVAEGKVNGWDDPRMPTIVGLRRRGYTPESLKLFAERIGVSKSDSWIDYSTLEGCLREDLENKAHRAMAVLEPVKLVLTNWAEVFGSDTYLEACTQPALPHSALAEGQTPPADRVFKIGKEVWIEREDFEEVPPKGYKRLFPGNLVRLKGGYVIECTGCARDAAGQVSEVHAKVIPGTKSGTPGADSVKAKAAITWVGVADGVKAEVRLYDRLFLEAHPDAGGKDFLQALNPDSLKVVSAYVEPSLALAQADQKFQFERHGYFVADRIDHEPGQPVFNRAVGLKDSWGK